MAEGNNILTGFNLSIQTNAILRQICGQPAVGTSVAHPGSHHWAQHGRAHTVKLLTMLEFLSNRHEEVVKHI
jgi:hypothetical protein